MTVLLREAMGDRLRHKRTTQSRTLREVSTSAQVSLGYLSEVERGRKEASSELLEAICDALDVRIADVLLEVSTSMADEMTPRTAEAAQSVAAQAVPRMVIPQHEVERGAGVPVCAA